LVRDVTVTPVLETYPPGGSLNVSATLPIIPAGPTTFIEGYTMVLTTDLDQAAWNVRVMADGRQAAVFQKFGRTVFVNGYLLSYPVTTDVEITIKIDGMVPPSTAENTFSVLRVYELNNQGQFTPGSEQIITRTLHIPVPSATSSPSSDYITEIPTEATNTEISPSLVIGSIFLIIFISSRKNR
jgi:hypothetical protein